MRRQASTWAVRIQPRKAFDPGKPRRSGTLKAAGGTTANGRGGAPRGGLADHGTCARTAQEPGRPLTVHGSCGAADDPHPERPARPAFAYARRAGSEKRTPRGGPTARGTTAPADAAGESEGRLRATTPG